MTLLQIENLEAGYGQHQILFGISFVIERGIVVVLLGPNGSGKSTLAKSLVGLVRVKKGRIVFEQQEITRLQTEHIVRLGIGYVPQRRNVFAHLTVAENLEMGLIAAKNRDTLSFDEIYQQFPELKSTHVRKAWTLSGGERQLLAIAKALLSKPKILILDEPSAGLSYNRTEQIFTLIRTLSSNGITILMVEQNVNQALMYADQGYVLEQGVISLSDTAANLRKSFLGKTNKGLYAF